MKRGKAVLALFFVISLFLQIKHFNNSDIFYHYGFAIGIDSSVKQFDIGVSLIYMLLPIIFIVFLLSGSVDRIKSDYGKLLMIRGYSKTKLYLRNLIKNNIIILIVVFAQIAVYYFFNVMFKYLCTNIFKSVLMYYAVLSLIITIQCLLELELMSNVANIAIFIYCYVSCFAAQVLQTNAFVKILLFPCLLFGMQNGAVTGNDIYFMFLGTAILLNAVITLAAVFKFKKIDIF